MEHLSRLAFVACLLSLAAAGYAGEAAAPKANTAGEASRGTEAAFTVHLDRSAGEASPLLYGCSLPAPGSPEARLLSPELLRNGSFEMAPSGKAIPFPEGWSGGRGWHLLACGPKRFIVRSELGFDGPLVLIGNRLWKNYEISLLARKTSGPGGFRILFEVQDAENHLQWTLGGGGNRWHVLESVGRGKPRVLAPLVVGRIEPGRAYRINISVRDNVISCSLDGRLIHRFGDAHFPAAGIGLGGADATVEYFGLTARKTPDVPLFLLDEPEGSAPGAGTKGTVGAAAEGSGGKSDGKQPAGLVPPASGLRTDTLAGGWEPMCSPGNIVGYRWEFVYPFNSQFSQRIGVDKYGGGDAGIRQAGVPVEAGEALRGRIALRGTVGLSAEVSLRGRDGKVQARQELENIQAKWTEYDLNLLPSGNGPAEEFCVSVKGTGTVWVDGASLVRAKDSSPLGLRREAVDALRSLRPTILRWPTGLAAPTYDWHRGLGPASQRPIVAVSEGERKGGEEGKTKEKESSGLVPPALGLLSAASGDFGLDEFLVLSKELGAAPMLVANPLLGIGPNLDCLEYCNGTAGTLFGKQRVANGHAEAYGVRLWHVPAVGAPEKDHKSSPEPRLSLPKALREQDATIRVIEGHRDWVPASAADAAARLNRLTREGGAGAVATCPLVAPAGAPAEGLLSAGPEGLRPSPAFDLFRLFRDHSIERLCAVDGPSDPSKIDLVAGRCGKEVVIRAANCGEAEAKIVVNVEGLGPGQLPAKAEHFSVPGRGATRVEAEAVSRDGNRLVFGSAPGSVHVLVLRLP